MRYLPAHVHLVLSSRTPSAVMTSRVIVQQQVTGVGPDELRFRPDEVGRWLAARDAAADAAAVDRLVAITEGWVAGMVLQSAADDVTLHPGIPAAELYDYLSSEVLDRQPPNVRDFLLQVAVLPELSVSLAQNVLGLENAAALLDTVQRQQLFLQPVGGRDEPVYRLHQLFRDFLASRLAATDPARFVDLHSRAAGYYAAQGDFPAAMEQHFQIADWHAAATLAADVGPAEIEAGRVERVERWIARFPAGEHHRWPGLLLLEARLLAVQAELVSASDMLTWGERLLLEAGDRRGYADALVLRAGFAAGQGNGTQMVEYAQQALAISEAAPATRARAQHMAAIGYTFAGDSARSEAAYAAAQVAYAALGDRQATAVLTSDWGFSLVLRQDVQRAALQLERALDYARQANNRRLQARVLSNLAEVYQTRGEMDEARGRYTAAAEIARSLRWHRVEAEALQGLADIALVEQGPRAAEQLYEQSAEAARTGSPATLVAALAGIACCRRRQGRYEAAARAAQRGLDLADGGQMPAPAALCRLELGAAQMVHEPAKAIALLREAEAELHALDRRPLAARCAAALATALAAAYDYVGAAEALARAYAVADPRGVALQLAPELATATGLALIRHADGGSGRYAGLLQEVVHYLETELRAEGDADDEPLQIVRRRPRVLEVYSFGRAAVFRDGVALAGF